MLILFWRTRYAYKKDRTLYWVRSFDFRFHHERRKKQTSGIVTTEESVATNIIAAA